jgi:hypothetical protein
MSHPSTYYIKYLVAKGWPNGENPVTINQSLEDLGLLKISDEEFDRIAASLSPPKGFVPQNPSHQPTMKFMRAEKIFSIWQPSKDDKDVLDLFLVPQVKETIQILLMGRLPAEEIAIRVDKKYSRETSVKLIEAFSHYFWNVKLASLQEWNELLYRHSLRDHYLAALWGSRNQALFRAGFSPQIDGKKALREAHRNIAMRLEASRMLPDTKDTTAILGRLSKELVMVHMALFGEGAGLEESMRDLKKFKMERNEENNVVSIHSLAPKGNFSGSGVTRKEEEKKDGST